MSDANRTQLGIVKESVLGTIPTNPKWKLLRFTQSALAFNPRTVTSQEIRADRQITDLIRVGSESGGTTGHEVSFGALDDLIEGVLSAVWVSQNERHNDDNATVITAVSGTQYTFTTGTAFAADDLVYASGFTNSANNGLKVATAGTATTLDAAGLVAETPPQGAKLKTVGLQYASGDISSTATTLVTAAGDFLADGIVPGMWIFVGGLVAGDTNSLGATRGWGRVGTVTASTITWDAGFAPATSGVDAGTGKSVWLFFGDYIRNGTTPTSYTIEQQFQDLATPEYHYFTGMRVGALQLQAGAQAILTAGVTFMGLDAQVLTTREAGSTDVPVPTSDILNTSSNVGRIAEGGADVTLPNYVVGANINIDATLRRQNAIGEDGSIGIGLGTFNITGQLETYYGSKALRDKLIANTATSYDIRLQDAAGAVIILDLPRIKFSQGDPTVPGINQDRMLPLGFQAIRHPTLDYTIQFQRIAFAPTA